jgi:hypothetical protein
MAPQSLNRVGAPFRSAQVKAANGIAAKNTVQRRQRVDDMVLAPKSIPLHAWGLPMNSIARASAVPLSRSLRREKSTHGVVTASFTPLGTRVAQMKSTHAGKSHLLRTTTISGVLARLRGSDDLKERAMTDVVLSAGFVVVVVLYVVMFVGLYRWSRYAPIFPPDGAAGPPIEETMPW